MHKTVGSLSLNLPETAASFLLDRRERFVRAMSQFSKDCAKKKDKIPTQNNLLSCVLKFPAIFPWEQFLSVRTSKTSGQTAGRLSLYFEGTEENQSEIKQFLLIQKTVKNRPPVIEVRQIFVMFLVDIFFCHTQLLI